MRFRDLRRLLFWHGRDFGLKLNYFTIWCIYKRSIFGCSSWFFNFQNGLSAINPTDNLIMALFPVCMTNFAQSFWVIYSHDINRGKYGKDYASEKKLPFHLSDLYSLCRNEQKQFITRFVYFFLYGWASAYMIYQIFFGTQVSNGGMLSQNGQCMGSFLFGVESVICVCSVYHIHCMMNVREWNVMMAGIWLASVSFCIIVLLGNNIMPKAETYMSLSYTMSEPLIWLQIFLTVGMICMPLYFAGRFQQVIMYPQFWAVDC